MDARAAQGRKEQTLLGRLRRPSAAPPASQLRGASGGAGHPAPRAPSAAPPLEPGWLERLVLVAHTFGRARAPALLEGLRASECLEARALLGQLVTRSSADRQARIAQQFGPTPEAAERLRSLMREASAPLQAEILRRLPPYYRSLFAPGTASSRPAALPPAMGALAERLIREATR